jgi:hypothetical protein
MDLISLESSVRNRIQSPAGFTALKVTLIIAVISWEVEICGLIACVF